MTISKKSRKPRKSIKTLQSIGAGASAIFGSLLFANLFKNYNKRKLINPQLHNLEQKPLFRKTTPMDTNIRLMSSCIRDIDAYFPIFSKITDKNKILKKLKINCNKNFKFDQVLNFLKNNKNEIKQKGGLTITLPTSNGNIQKSYDFLLDFGKNTRKSRKIYSRK